MSRQRSISVCRCGAQFRVLTYLPRDTRCRRQIWHCECPPCEAISLRVVAAVAVVLEGTHVGLICMRVAQ